MKIGDLSRQTGCSIQTIRFYERKGLLSEPKRTEANYRVYDDKSEEILKFIKQCRAHDMSINEIKELIENRENPEQSCESVNVLIDEHIEQVTQRIEDLLSLKKSLLQMAKSCSTNRTIKECGILSNLGAHN